MSPFDKLASSAMGTKLLTAPVARWGYQQHLADDETPRVGYQAMRKLYGAPTTAAFDALAARAAGEHPLLDLPAQPAGLLAGRVDEVVRTLEDDGFAVLPEPLDPAICDELEAAARAATCVLVDPIEAAGGATTAVFDESAPVAVRYEVAEDDAVAIAAAQRLLADESLLAVAQRYLGAAPVQDLVAMWWSAAVGRRASSAAAQLFHHDLDRLRFLKWFVFLTDVDEDTGPHVYARGSHRSKPRALRLDGRHADAEVEAAYPGDCQVIAGPRGTMFMADTIGMHKGLDLHRGHRLVFQLEWATSLFGAPFTRPAIAEPGPELAAVAARYPATYRRFRLGGGS